MDGKWIWVLLRIHARAGTAHKVMIPQLIILFFLPQSHFALHVIKYPRRSTKHSSISGFADQNDNQSPSETDPGSPCVTDRHVRLYQAFTTKIFGGFRSDRHSKRRYLPNQAIASYHSDCILPYRQRHTTLELS